jgi:hypothetical protein
MASLGLLIGTALPASAALQVGSPNVATADPPVTRPATTPCVVTLYTDFVFADFTPKSFSYAPPAGCPGPWAKVVLEADFSVTTGRQFDRTGNIWIGGASVYFGTTQEPSRTVSPSWHIERDLTDYSALLAGPQPGLAILGNIVNSTFTGVIHGSADLQFYPLAPGQHAARVPDRVLPLSDGPQGGVVNLVTSADVLERTFTLPTNVEAAWLDVFAQSQIGDEFWWTCVPDDVADTLESCGGGSFRESQITIDGHPAGIAPVFPWIFTGGIDPLLWRPIPSVQTLSFVPHRVNLTPFAALLSDGAPHRVGVSVFGAHNYFSVTASLLLNLDPGQAQVTGALTANTLGAAPSPVTTEDVKTVGSETDATVTIRSSRSFTIAGFVNTSHGRVNSQLDERVDFASKQTFKISPTVFVQGIDQRTTVFTTTTTTDAGGVRVAHETLGFPLLVSFNQVVNADNSGSFATSIQQRYDRTQIESVNNFPPRFSIVSSAIAPSDTLLFNASGAITGSQGQRSTHQYFSTDSTGACYSRQITAATGLLTEVRDGEGCQGSGIVVP